MINIHEFPLVDPDFDDLEMFDNDIEDASPEEQELYDFWCEYDERQADKVNRRSQP